jgi:hypothetical protein
MKAFLTRNKLYQRKAPSREAKKVYIFCEGDREVSYFNYCLAQSIYPFLKEMMAL